MARTSYPGIAREGWPLIAAAIVGGVAAWFIDPEWSALFAAIALALMLKFRDPERPVPAEPLGVVSPVDGIVELVEQTRDPCIDREATRIRIRIHRFGTYGARAPVEGRVLDFNGNGNGNGEACGPGPRGMWLQTDEKDDVVLILNSGPAFARPHALLAYGSRTGQGQRCAWLRLARIAEVYVPAGSQVKVEPGRRVLAGMDVLASFVHD